MFSLSKLTNIFISLTLSLLMVACNSSSDDESASISLAITDAPVDGATEVVVEFTGVELKPSGGSSIDFDFDVPQQIDLLALQGSNAANLLSNIEIEAGNYQWMRLKVNAQRNTMDSFITFENGNSFSLSVPSGNETGLKLVKGFVVTQGSHASFVIDFDLRKSIVNPNGLSEEYFLKPALRLINNNEAGHIQGTISNTIAEQESCNNGIAVYVYEGNDIVADDEGSTTPPLTSAMVQFNTKNDSSKLAEEV